MRWCFFAVYVNVGESKGPVKLSVTLEANQTRRDWKIRVVQIPCGSTRLGE